jgi:putative membrane protein
VWRQTIEALTDALSQGHAADGFVRAIEICGAELKKHVPPVTCDSNELPNRVILI